MKTLSYYLNRTYPYFYGDRRNNVLMLLFGSSFVLYVMLVIRPDIAIKNIYTNYTVVSFAVALIPISVGMLWMELLPRLVKKWFYQWKVYKELIFFSSCILAMGILNCVCFFFFGNPYLGHPWITSLKIILITLSSGMIPLSVITLFNFVKLERMRRKSIPVFFQETGKPPESNVNSIELQEGEEEVFRLELEETYAIESMGNYVKIHQVQDQTDRVYLKRVTMKKMEGLLEHQQKLIRIHRCYFVNLSHVSRMHKDDSGDLFLLFAYDKSIRVPVSRNKRKELSDLLKHLTTV
jgi:LytTr DNA-binding domain